MLFFPLIENSFKHGVKGVSDRAYVHIEMTLEENEITFVIENNKGEVDEVEHGKFGGIGLENVKRRLALIYPGSHNLEIENTEETYRVSLNIKIWVFSAW